MNPDFNRFEFFTESELVLIALKFMDENEKFIERMSVLPKREKDEFLYKFLHAFVLHEGKEDQEELITKFLSRYK